MPAINCSLTLADGSRVKLLHKTVPGQGSARKITRLTSSGQLSAPHLSFMAFLLIQSSNNIIINPSRHDLRE